MKKVILYKGVLAADLTKLSIARTLPGLKLNNVKSGAALAGTVFGAIEPAKSGYSVNIIVASALLYAALAYLTTTLASISIDATKVIQLKKKIQELLDKINSANIFKEEILLDDILSRETILIYEGVVIVRNYSAPIFLLEGDGAITVRAYDEVSPELQNKITTNFVKTRRK